MVFTLAVFATTAADPASAQDQGPTSMEHMHHHHHAVFAKVPEKVRTRPNPLATDPDAIAAGKKMFAEHCAECHGESAQGIRGKAPNLHKEEVQNATPGAIFWVLSNGIIRHGMPDWSKLPEAQRWQIAAYIKSLPPTSRDVASPAMSPSNEHTEQ
jgi:mono/diheme cytochrome c family protein